MKHTLIASLALISCAGLSWAGAPAGKELYTAKCVSCHGANGEGKPAIAKMFNVTQGPLASVARKGKDDAELPAIIGKGEGKMRRIAAITEKQAAGVVAFVRTLK